MHLEFRRKSEPGHCRVNHPDNLKTTNISGCQLTRVSLEGETLGVEPNLLTQDVCRDWCAVLPSGTEDCRASHLPNPATSLQVVPCIFNPGDGMLGGNTAQSRL